MGGRIGGGFGRRWKGGVAGCRRGGVGYQIGPCGVVERKGGGVGVEGRGEEGGGGDGGEEGVDASVSHRFAVFGPSFAVYATPLTLLTLPASVSSTGESSLTVGRVSWTSPPPRGGAPRFLISSEAPAIPKCRSSGSVTVRSTSMPMSRASFVTPLRLIEMLAWG